MKAVFKGIRTYVTRRQNTVTQYIATQPILDIFEGSSRRTGVWVSLRWWEQGGLDLGRGAKKRALAESDGEEAIRKDDGIPLEKITGRE